MDNELKGEGNSIDYEKRFFDPRIGKFLSIDPLIKDFPHYSPYQFAGNTPIWAIDLDGAEEYVYQLKLIENGKGEPALKPVYKETIDDWFPNVLDPDKYTLLGLDGKPIGLGLSFASLDGMNSHIVGKNLQQLEDLSNDFFAIQAVTTYMAAESIERDQFTPTYFEDDDSEERFEDNDPPVVLKTKIPNQTPKSASKQSTVKNVSNGRAGKQARLREWKDDPKASKSDRGWLRNDQRHIETGNKNGLRIPRNGRKSPGRKKEDKGYELAHPSGKGQSASSGNGYGGSKAKNAADHRTETRIHQKRYKKK